MPSKNILKYYKPNSFYHIYNRGVAKQKIFHSDKDYKTFLMFLKTYLSPIDLQGRTLKVAPSRELKNYATAIKLVAYCLMPNHFHLLVFQQNKFDITNLMRSLGTKYSRYFNNVSDRVGPLFQSRYKAVRVFDKEQLVYLSKYIHKNPVDILPSRTDLVGYKYSSYGNYLGLFSQVWVQPEDILELYYLLINKKLPYKNFVENEQDNFNCLKNKLLDT